MKFFTQEIVLFREDLLRKIQRNSILTPIFDQNGENGGTDITQQLVESILDQAHLCPLPLCVKPVYWELDYTLRLTPLPHLVRDNLIFINLFDFVLFYSICIYYIKFSVIFFDVIWFKFIILLVCHTWYVTTKFILFFLF